MAQERFLNYKTDDLTTRLNAWFLGIMNYGRYAGFDFNPSANMTLELNHNTTGIETANYVDPPVLNAKKGVLMTRQGTVVKEDDVINVPIEPGDALDRIDLIVCSHKYVLSTGGAAATYSVIKGTPDANPVAPALSLPAQQVVIGELYIPTGTTQLDQAGVVFTQSIPPDNGIISQLRALIEAETAARISAINSEASARINQDTILAADIGQESLDRENADSALTSALAVETSQRTIGDNERTLKSRLDSQFGSALFFATELIGPWDMNAANSKTVDLSSIFADASDMISKIITVDCMVFSDNDFFNFRTDLFKNRDQNGFRGWYTISFTGTAQITLNIDPGSFWKTSSEYNNGGINRGEVLVIYKQT